MDDEDLSILYKPPRDITIEIILAVDVKQVDQLENISRLLCLLRAHPKINQQKLSKLQFICNLAIENRPYVKFSEDGIDVRKLTELVIYIENVERLVERLKPPEQSAGCFNLCNIQ